MLTKITHITLFVDDQDEALEFYKKLGFVVHTDATFEDMRWLTLHMPHQKDVELAIMQAETEEEKDLVGQQAGDKPFLSLESDNCQADYEKLIAEGVEIIEEPVEQPWGVSMMIEDVCGNLIYICQPSK